MSVLCCTQRLTVCQLSMTCNPAYVTDADCNDKKYTHSASHMTTSTSSSALTAGIAAHTHSTAYRFHNSLYAFSLPSMTEAFSSIGFVNWQYCNNPASYHMVCWRSPVRSCCRPVRSDSSMMSNTHIMHLTSLPTTSLSMQSLNC